MYHGKISKSVNSQKTITHIEGHEVSCVQQNSLTHKQNAQLMQKLTPKGHLGSKTTHNTADSTKIAWVDDLIASLEVSVEFSFQQPKVEVTRQW